MFNEITITWDPTNLFYREEYFDTVHLDRQEASACYDYEEGWVVFDCEVENAKKVRDELILKMLTNLFENLYEIEYIYSRGLMKYYLEKGMTIFI
jgi:hypothetical protein